MQSAEPRTAECRIHSESYDGSQTIALKMADSDARMQNTDIMLWRGTEMEGSDDERIGRSLHVGADLNSKYKRTISWKLKHGSLEPRWNDLKPCVLGLFHPLSWTRCLALKLTSLVDLVRGWSSLIDSTKIESESINSCFPPRNINRSESCVWQMTTMLVATQKIFCPAAHSFVVTRV